MGDGSGKQEEDCHHGDDDASHDYRSDQMGSHVGRGKTKKFDEYYSFPRSTYVCLFTVDPVGPMIKIIFEYHDRQTSMPTNSKNVNEQLFGFYPWCIAYTLNNPFMLNLTAIQQMATRLQPLTIAGTYGSIREI